MSELTAEVRVVIHASDRPAARMDHEDLAILPTGRDELVVYLRPEDAEPWLEELSARVREALGNAA